MRVALLRSLSVLDTFSIIASQNAMAIYETTSSSTFPGWNSPIPSFQELCTHSTIFENDVILTFVLVSSWLFVGARYGLYNRDRIYFEDWPSILDITNQQFVIMTNIVIVSSLIYVYLVHQLFPVAQITLSPIGNVSLYDQLSYSLLFTEPVLNVVIALLSDRLRGKLSPLLYSLRGRSA